MKTLAAFLAITLSFVAPATPALAADCAQAANAVAAQYGGAKILSVHEEGGACVITLLVPGSNGQPPRRQTVRVGG